MGGTIIVTGASRGIGWAITQHLLKLPEAPNVVAVARSHEPLQRLKAEYGAQVEILSADLGDLSTAREAVGLALSAYGRLDALVINHGQLDPVTKVVESDIDEWKKGFDTNFFSAIAFLKVAIPQLRLTRGRIVFTSSGAAVAPTTGWGCYGASKAALNHLNMTVAREEPEITSVSIRPGMVNTQMQADLREKHTEALGEQDAHKYVSAYKENRLLRPEQPAHVIANLAVRATRELSGKFMTWNDTDLADFQDE